jgi:hypothetical protein
MANNAETLEGLAEKLVPDEDLVQLADAIRKAASDAQTLQGAQAMLDTLRRSGLDCGQPISRPGDDSDAASAVVPVHRLILRIHAPQNITLMSPRELPFGPTAPAKTSVSSNYSKLEVTRCMA